MKKRIISALLVLSMVVALPVGTVLADEVVQTDDVTVGQEYPVPETPVEGNEDTAEDIVPEAPIEDNSEGAAGDVTPEDPTEETPADETEVSENEAENDLIATYADDTTYTYGDLTYIIENNQITITDCNEYAVSVDIPAEINGIPVTSIGRGAFEYCTRLTSIKIPDSIISIGDYAFYQCGSLTSITIPDGVTSIGYEAFCKCTSLTSITIPESVTSIGRSAFHGCTNLTSITIPNSITSIGNDTFAHCKSITSITIPDSVTSIGENAFYGCTSLTSITIPDSVTDIGGAFCRCTSLTSITIPNSITSIGNYTFAYCKSLTSITIPDSVTSIGDSAFGGCTSLTSITIPNSVTSMGYDTFSDCTSLTSITIPDSITSIGENAFCRCTSLTSVTIPNSVTKIGRGAFANCTSLTSITIPNRVTYMGDYAFSGCTGLTSITISEGVTYINGFSHCTGLTSLTIPNSVTKIGKYAFEDCTNLTNITFSENLQAIGYDAFQSCISLTELNIPDSVTDIDSGAFQCCEGLSYITIPPNVTSLGITIFSNCPKLKTAGPTGDDYNIQFGWKDEIPDNAFDYCNYLESITIPDSINNIGSRAFYGCTELKDVYYTGNQSDWEAITIGSSNEPLLNATIHYNSTGPDETTEPGTEIVEGILRTTDGCKIIWGASYKPDSTGQPKNVNLTIAVINADDTEEELYLYNESVENGFPMPWELEPYNIPKSAITELVIHGESNKKLCTISGMFRDYTNLREATFTNVSSIDSYTFDGCKNLTTLHFYDGSPTTIGSCAFRNCSKLEYITLYKETTYIGANAFQNCKSLGVITLQKEVTNIGKEAFDGSNIVIRCYYQSAAHKYAEENDIEFWLIDPPKAPLPFYSPLGNKTTYWDIGWSWDLFNLSTTQYDSRLAAFGMSISAATESDSPERAKNMLENDLGFDKAEGYNYSDWNPHNPGVVCAYKKIDHKDRADEYIIIVAVRGTTSGGDVLTDVLSTDFGTTAKNIKSNLETFMKDNDISKEAIQNSGTIFVTGHSLGGAVANKLAVELNDEYGLNHVAAYTFAAPATINLTTNIDNAISGFVNKVIGKKNTWKKDQNIFNIIHNLDNVPGLKSYVGNDAWYGKTVSFDLKSIKRQPSLNQKYYDTFTEIAGRTLKMTSPVYALDLGFMDLGWHHVETYMAYVLSDGGFTQNEINAVKHIKLVKIACPVDVEVYDSNNQLIGAIINDTITNDSSSAIAMYIEDSEKYLLLMDDDDYMLKINSTGTETMDYSVYDVSFGTNEAVAQKEFKNVSLESGKKFTSFVSVWDKTDPTINSSGKVDTLEVPLYVIDDNGKPEKEVLPDGNGTEVPINNNNTPTTPVTPNRPATPDNGGSSSNTNTGTSTVSPVGGTKTETMTVNINNKVTGKTSKVTAKKTGNSVTIKLGTENNGYYANVYTTNDEYIYSALIENGRAEFNIPDGIKIKIVIDSIAYGEDVSAGAGASADGEPVNIPYSVIIVLIAAFGIYFKHSKKYSDHKVKR